MSQMSTLHFVHFTYIHSCMSKSNLFTTSFICARGKREEEEERRGEECSVLYFYFTILMCFIVTALLGLSMSDDSANSVTHKYIYRIYTSWTEREGDTHIHTDKQSRHTHTNRSGVCCSKQSIYLSSVDARREKRKAKRKDAGREKMQWNTVFTLSLCVVSRIY